MPDEHIINPWLTEQIRVYKAAHADAELREAYYRLREADPDRTWFGFLIDSSVQAAIRENPFLGRKFIDTDLPGHTVDILLAHEIDSVAFLMQVSLQELSSLAGVTEADVRAVVDFLREGGLRLEEKGFTRKQSFSWEELERQPAESIRKQAKEKIKALDESCDIELDDWYRAIADIHRETVLLLRTIGADKETLRKAIYEQARFLRDEIPEHPENTGEALDAAWEDQEISEYLFGTYSKENALAWELQADILFMGGRYAEALEKYSKLVRILEKSPRADREFLVEARRSAGICLIGLDRPAEALPLLLEAFSYYEKHPDEYRERLFWMSHTISRAYDMLGDFQKRQEYMDLAGKYDDDPIE